MTQEGMKQVVIHMWCAPRSLSTATLYSFSQRPDTKVYDEALYPCYLHNNPSIYRPYREELLATSRVNSDEIMDNLNKGDSEKPVVFVKHMAKFAPGINRRHFYGKDIRNVFLIRDPMKQIASWKKKLGVHKEVLDLESSGLLHLFQFYTEMKRHTASSEGGPLPAPIVLDSDMLAAHPQEMLQHLCQQLEIPFYDEQLSWPAGAKPDIDGMWAKWWYDDVHKSTGFGKYVGLSGSAGDTASEPPRVYVSLTEEEKQAYRDAAPFYDLLKRNAIGVQRWNPGTCKASPAAAAEWGNELTTCAKQQQQIATMSDPRNADLLIWVGDRLRPRADAKVSVFDSVVQGGDGVWEGLRVYDGRIFKMNEHLERLFHSAKALAYEGMPSYAYVVDAIFQTLAANGMRDGVHMRVTITRGPKVTSSMNPKFNIFGCNLLVVAEYKLLGSATVYNNDKGVDLVTAVIRRNSPEFLDSKVHHCNMLNNIMPKLQANLCGAADAVMLDAEGFVSETNATNLFLVKHGRIYTPFADACVPGITRATVMDIAAQLGIPCVEKKLSLTEFYVADEVFTTGTMGELTPVNSIDQRTIAPTEIGQNDSTNTDVEAVRVTGRLQEVYKNMAAVEGVKLPF